jgi:hypothetical protein
MPEEKPENFPRRTGTNTDKMDVHFPEDSLREAAEKEQF